MVVFAPPGSAELQLGFRLLPGTAELQLGILNSRHLTAPQDLGILESGTHANTDGYTSAFRKHQGIKMLGTSLSAEPLILG